MFWWEKAKAKCCRDEADDKNRKGYDDQHNMRVAIAILRIADESKTTRNQAETSEKNKSRREWITIWLIFFTFGASALQSLLVRCSIQDAEVANTISQRSADAATKAVAIQQENERAWIGPTDATFDSNPILSKPITVSISYQNTGHEPATSLVRSVNFPFISGVDANQNPVSALIQDNVVKCKMTSPEGGGQIAVPNAAGTAYTKTH